MARPAGSLFDISQTFAGRPLFDGELSQELAAYERRAHSGSSAPAAHQHHSSGYGPSASAYDNSSAADRVFRPVSHSGRSASAPWHSAGVGGGHSGMVDGQALPPEIQRPAALQWLLDARTQSPSLQPMTRDSLPRAANDAAPLSHQPQPDAHRGYADAQGTVRTPRRATESPSASSRRRAAAAASGRRRQRRRDGSGVTIDQNSTILRTQYDSDSEAPARRNPHRANPDRNAGSGARDAAADDADVSRVRPPQQQRGSSSDDSGGGRNTRLAPTDAEGWTMRKLENMDDNIERALARRDITASRLHDIGQHPAGTRIDGGVQTDPPKAEAKSDRLSPTDPRLVDTMARRHASNLTPPVGYVLQPSDGKGYAVQATHDASPTPSAAADASLHPAGREGSLAWARSPDGERGVGGGPRETVASREAASRVHGTRDSFLSRLDQLQLANEELLVKTKALGGSDGLAHEQASKAERDAASRVIDRVGAANRNAPVAFAPPAGGYGSVLDGSRTGADPEARWRDAKVHNDLRKDHESTGVDVGASSAPALRQWATDVGAASSRKLTRSEVPRSAQRDPYSARKKWGAVSFAVPDGPDHGDAYDHIRQQLATDYRMSHSEAARNNNAQQQGSTNSGSGDGAASPAGGFSMPNYGFIEARNNDAPAEVVGNTAAALYHEPLA